MSVIFLDIDGTYASHGAVPAAHVEAVRRVRANGHRVLLCTGRPRSAVSERLTEAGFDGLVCGAGAYAEVDGEVLADVTFPRELADRSIDVLLAHHAQMIVESTQALHVLDEAAALMDRRAPGEGASGAQAAVWEDLLAARRVVDDLHGLDFAKIVTMSAASDLSAIAAEIGDEVAAVETSIQDLGRGAGELYLAHITKAVGIQVVLDHLGLTAADAVGAGDGPNDLEMLAMVGTAIGIEGGHPGVIAAADIVVPGPEQAGLAQAFARLGLA
ncbi:HAD-IIB family hydrolase [Demequina sp. NBRC 110057]|uniref:HAD-IIB family hydrolase n=1 Tax=Demequina sp. NBRC 110057 TaxID=1570346 RepID=UPI00190E8921|nr:HAD-IIB family hydrolase [Demequina sp. NBRC 110057]